MKQFIKIKVVKIILFAFILFAAGITNAQIGIGIPSPNASAQLDVSSTSKGFLPPRMTQAERNAITKPAAGLIIWCKDCGVTGEIQVYNGIAWKNLVGADPAAALPKSVTIGTQEWMTKNLDVVTYRNGDTIPQVTDSAQWVNLTTGAWCYYNNDPGLGAIFGKLYNWYAVNDDRGLAPAGWHIPYEYWGGSGEWSTLLKKFSSGEDAAIKMKATILWDAGSSAATNSSGFTALPGGFRNVNGGFEGLRNAAKWWGQESDYMYGFTYIIGAAMNGTFGPEQFAEIPPEFDDMGNRFHGTIPKLGAFSVRCVRDNTVKIGEQTWMLKNLEVSTFRNGDIIPEITDPVQWANATGPAWCYNTNDPANGAIYGKLYNWYAVHDSRGLVPSGFHIPDHIELTQLQTFLGGPIIAGGKMKEAGTEHWNAPNTGATNVIGFTALPGGFRHTDGGFQTVGIGGNWWASDLDFPDHAFSCGLSSGNSNLGIGSNILQAGFSVRCIGN